MTKLPGNRSEMCKLAKMLLITSAIFAFPDPAFADEEASNVSHVVAGAYGRCYAKSVPKHIYDPEGEPRQQGRTEVYQVGHTEDILVQKYDWFSQKLIVRCRPGSSIVVRLGPWHRGHEPREDHLAIAFYKGKKLIRRYSTLDMAGGEKSGEDVFSRYENVSASVSHYNVFSSWPEAAKVTTKVGPIIKEDWVIKARTIDGRLLIFDIETGELR